MDFASIEQEGTIGEVESHRKREQLCYQAEPTIDDRLVVRVAGRKQPNSEVATVGYCSMQVTAT